MIIPGRPLHRETQRVIRGFYTRDSVHIESLDLLIRGLHDAGLWPKITAMCIAGPDVVSSLTNLKEGPITVRGAGGSFTAYKGFTTVPPSDGRLYTQVTLTPDHAGNLHLACYTQDAPGGSGDYYMGELNDNGDRHTLIGIRDAASGETEGYAQNNVNVAVAYTDTQGGFRAVSRKQGSQVLLKRQSLLISKAILAAPWGDAHFPISVGSLNPGALAGLGDVVANTFSFWSVGYGLSAQELEDLYQLVEAYFVTHGTEV
jgi:hypothetical protein